ncbi:6-pyruvoyl-tetrahydropterin synthase-related protein [Vagococcus zengguangii]|uniref:6-pyruvoyl-tetrahydropterin synthase-related protein n=1 Tax=Vagococcus zengguangii TaxID=2571750 RepID=UPI001108F769|nr:6-pyruvoyl-tetrahydropterin synthase-related protein [Vagococcus zengguangii]TLG80927.1 hypothetical protein FE258_03300 [Vagococcus zengguangii]
MKIINMSCSQKRLLSHQLLILGSFILATLVSSSHLFKGGYVVIRSSDFYFHFNRFVGVIESLSSGNGLPKINTIFLNGWGYPSPLFYGDFILSFGFIFYKLGFTALTSYKLFLMTLTFFCFVSTYYSMKVVVKKIEIAYLIALLYTLSTFRLYDLFVRNALGEAIAFIFLPLIFVGMWSIRSKQEPSRWLLLALGMSGLVMTHLLTTIIVIIFLLLMIIIDNRSYLRNKTNFISLLKAAGLTLGLSAMFVWPMLEQLVKMKLTINTNQLPIKSLFLTDFGKLIQQSLSNHALVSGNIGLLLLAPLVIRGILGRDKANNSLVKLADTVAILGVLTMMAGTSLLPWDTLIKLPIISFIQFPFRWLSIATLLLAISGGIYLFEWTNSAVQVKLARVALLILITFLTMSYSQKISRTKGDKVINQTAIQPQQIGTGEEYLPIETDKTWVLSQTRALRYNKSQIEISQESVAGTTITFNYENANQAQVSLPLLYYPGYQAINNVSKEKLVITTGKHGEMVLNSLNGKGEIQVSYEGTLIQKVSLCVSLISTIILGMFLTKRWKHH